MKIVKKHTCTTLLVGKKATLDGSTIVCREEDYGNAFDPQRFTYVKPTDQPRHYQSKTTDFTIDLPDTPVGYTSTPDADSSAGIFAAGGINQHNVAMTGTETITTNSRILGIDPFNATDGIGEEDFVTLVLPYIRTAREGVERLGHLLERYGTYESNAISFGDHDEVWYMETIGGHHWAAVRIPDDAFVIAPNRLNIDDFDFTSADTCCSADLKGLIDDNRLNPALDGHYNLRQIFGSQTVTDTRYNNPRAWYVQQQLSTKPTGQPTDQDLPFICRPRHKLAIEEIKQVMSSHYQGTSFDPYEHDQAPYRSIALNRNLELHILQIRNNVPAAIAGIHWLAFGPNAFNTVVPFYANITDTPASYRDTPINYDAGSMYWLTHTIAAIGDAHYAKAQSAVEAYEQKVVAAGRHIQRVTDQQVDLADPQHQLDQANEQMATIAMKEATVLLGKLVKIAFGDAKLQY
ncbi:dipeptidase [Limosilactobacillus pontis]|uniref:Dipeptidase n=1 Tax=Limosilactobacillus pontis TaxID=35787 RepID=A0A2J6NKY2_9LACO|nr:dipeptidase [Limosilactobacillus pontis]